MNKKYIGLIFINITILISLTIFSFSTVNKTNYIFNWANIITTLSLILLAYHLIIFYKLKVNYSDFSLWFILLSNVFMFSRVYLIAFNLNEDIFWDLLSRYPESLLYETGLIVLCILQGIFTGLTLQKKSKKINNSIFLMKLEKRDLKKGLYNTGLILLLISLPFRLFIDINNIFHAQSASSYSSVSVQSGIVDDISLLFVPGIIYILSSKKKSKKKYLFMLTIVISYFIGIMILTGDRRYPVTAIIAFVLCYMETFNRKMSLRKIVLYLLSGSFLLNVLSVIRNIRSENLTSVYDFFSTYGKIILTNNPILETLSEFGLSFVSVVGVVKNIPEVIPFQKGLSFFGALPSVFPVGWLLGDFFQKVSISRLINNIEDYPVGATIIGDLYANFGWLSIFIGIIVGIVLAKMFQLNNNRIVEYQRANYFSLFYILINLVRSSFFEMVRPTILVYIIPLGILYILLANTKKYNTTI